MFVFSEAEKKTKQEAVGDGSLDWGTFAKKYNSGNAKISKATYYPDVTGGLDNVQILNAKLDIPGYNHLEIENPTTLLQLSQKKIVSIKESTDGRRIHLEIETRKGCLDIILN